MPQAHFVAAATVIGAGAAYGLYAVWKKLRRLTRMSEDIMRELAALKSGKALADSKERAQTLAELEACTQTLIKALANAQQLSQPPPAPAPPPSAPAQTPMGLVYDRHIQVEKRLGEGAFGEVWRGRWRGLPVALKFLKAADAEVVEDLQREAALLNTVDHKHVMRLYGMSVPSDDSRPGWPSGLRPPVLVCELMTNGDFAGFVKAAAAQRDERAHWRKVIEMLGGAANGMEYLHSMDVVHRDLKVSAFTHTQCFTTHTPLPPYHFASPHPHLSDHYSHLTSHAKALNLFVDGRGHLKIGDLGLAKAYDEHIRRNEAPPAPTPYRSASTSNGGVVPLGTYTHQAPEIVRPPRGETGRVRIRYAPPVDVFAFGIIVIEALGADEAEELLDETRVEVNRAKGKAPIFGLNLEGVRALLRDEWKCAETEMLISVADACTKIEPSARPTAQQLQARLNMARFGEVHTELKRKILHHELKRNASGSKNSQGDDE